MELASYYRPLFLLKSLQQFRRPLQVRRVARGARINRAAVSPEHPQGVGQKHRLFPLLARLGPCKRAHRVQL